LYHIYIYIYIYIYYFEDFFIKKIKNKKIVGVAEPPPSQMGVVSATPILVGPWGWPATQNFFFIYIYIKEIIKIIIKKNDSYISAEVYHGDMCRACTPTPVG
jgi:hypothetical protein